LWMLPSQMKDFSQSLVAVSLFASNILFWRESGYFDVSTEEKPLLHTWSLAVEEQYYVLFPIFLLLAWRFGKNRVFWMIVAMAAISLLLSEWGWRNKPESNFYLAPTRAWEILAGSIAAFMVQWKEVRKNNALAILGLAAIVFSIFFYNEATPFPSVYALVPVLGVFLIILYAEKETLAAKILSTQAFVSIGLVSYSAYLWHQPLFAFARIRLVEHPSPALMLTLSITSVALAYISYRYIEKPFRSHTIIPRKIIFISAFASIFIFTLLGYIGHIKDGFHERFPEQVSNILANDLGALEDSVGQCWGMIRDEPGVQSACNLGAELPTKSFVLIGDSHAGALQRALDGSAKKLGIAGLGLSYRSCPPLARINDTLNDQICTDLRKSIFSPGGIDSLPQNVIVHARWTLLVEQKLYTNDSGVTETGNAWVWTFQRGETGSYAEHMQEIIIDSLNMIVESGRHLIIVYPVPEMGWNIPELLATQLLNDRALHDQSGAVSYESFLQRNRAAFVALDEVGSSNHNGIVSRVYPHDIFCEQHCVSHFAGQVLYVDDNHLSNNGAEYVVNDILEIINIE
jgi:hypothetical protein